MMRLRLPALSLLVVGAVVATGAPTASAADDIGLRVVETFPSLSRNLLDIALVRGLPTGYVLDGSERVTVLDAASRTTRDSGLSGGPSGFSDLDLDREGSNLYAAGNDRVAVLPTTGEQSSTIALPGRSVTRLDVAPDADYLFGVGDGTSATVVDLGTKTASSPTFQAPFTTIPTRLDDVAARGPSGFIAVGRNSDGLNLWAFGPGPAFTPDGEMEGIRPRASGDERASIAMNFDAGLALITSPGESKIYVVEVSVVRPAVIQEIGLTSPAYSVEWAPYGSRAYVGTMGNVEVVQIGRRGSERLGVVPVGTGPVRALGVASSGNSVYAGGSPGEPLKLLSYSSVSAEPVVAPAGAPLAVSFTADGFDHPPTWTISPALPEGLTLDPATGAVSGTPAADTPPIDYTLTAESSDGNDASTTWRLDVEPMLGAAPSASPAPPGPERPTELAATGGHGLLPLMTLSSMGLLIGGALLVTSRRRRA